MFRKIAWPLAMPMFVMPTFVMAQQLIQENPAVVNEGAAPESEVASPGGSAAEAAGPAGLSEGTDKTSVIAVTPAAAESELVTQGQTTPSKNRAMEEIVVTAQKREENIQDVPISISAFSGDALDAKGILDAKSLAQSIPGVSYGETVNFSIVYIRGVGTEAFLPDSDMSVATYIDGIYYPFANGLAQTFGAVDRVEVLKGPQGTLFGRNSTGGAISTTTKLPDFTGTSFQLSSGYSSFNTFNSRLYANVPVTDTLAFNASLTYNSADYYYDGTRGDGAGGTAPFPKETEKGARMRVRWNPTEWADLTLSGVKHEKNGLGSSAMPNIDPSLLLQTAGLLFGKPTQTPRGEYSVHVDVPSYFALDNNVYYGQLQLKPEWFDVKLLGSYQHVKSDNNYDFDGTEVPLITFDARGQFAKVRTGELQFLSNKNGPEWLEWVAGLYYFQSRAGFPLNRLSVLSLDLSDGTLLGVLPVPQGLLNLLTQLQLPLVGTPDGLSLGLVSLQQTKSTAGFGQATFHLGDYFDITLGGRYQTENREVLESSIGTVNTDGSAPRLIQFDRPKKNDSNLSPKAVLSFKPSDYSMLYASYSKGFKSGTFNTVNVYTNPKYIRPEVVNSYELGAKSEIFDGRLRLNGAIFENDIKDQQVQVISLLAGGAVQLENAAKVQIRGAELEAQYTPDWDPNLVVQASAAYLDAVYDSYPDASGFTETGGVYNFGAGDNTGNRTVRTPRWSGQLGLNQLIELSRDSIEIGVNSFFSGDLYFSADNAAITRQAAYYVIDVQLSYLYVPANIRVTALGKNLNDERYALTQFRTDAGVQEVLAPPRSFGLRFDWTFGK